MQDFFFVTKYFIVHVFYIFIHSSVVGHLAWPLSWLLQPVMERTWKFRCLINILISCLFFLIFLILLVFLNHLFSLTPCACVCRVCLSVKGGALRGQLVGILPPCDSKDQTQALSLGINHSNLLSLLNSAKLPVLRNTIVYPGIDLWVFIFANTAFPSFHTSISTYYLLPFW